MANMVDVVRGLRDTYASLMEVGEFRGATLAQDDVVAERVKAFELAMERAQEWAKAHDDNPFSFPVDAPSPAAPMTGASLGSFGGVAVGSGYFGSAKAVDPSAMSAAEAQAELMREYVKKQEAEKAKKAIPSLGSIGSYDAALLPKGLDKDLKTASRVMEMMRSLGLSKGKGA